MECEKGPVNCAFLNCDEILSQTTLLPHLNTCHGISIQETKVTNSLNLTTSFSIDQTNFLEPTTWNPWRLQIENKDNFFLEMSRNQSGKWIIWLYFATGPCPFIRHIFIIRIMCYFRIARKGVMNFPHAWCPNCKS
jgi:hypothetical protein